MTHRLPLRCAASVLETRLRSLPAASNARRWKSKHVRHVKIDRSGLYQHPTAATERVAKPGLTPLAKELMSIIKLRGPLSIHEFMSQALNNAKHGYYQTK